MTALYVHLWIIHRASKKLHILAPSQTEEISGSPRFLDSTFYIKFNILLDKILI